MRKSASISLVFGLLGGCQFVPGTAAYEIDAAEDIVSQALIDPSSAQFRNVEYHSENGSICGEVNGKNRMGGYAGFVPFFVRSGEANLAPGEMDGASDTGNLKARTFMVNRTRICDIEPLQARMGIAPSEASVR